jgi:hypothetical protein
MCARQSVSVIGTQGSPYLEAGDWQFNFGYLWQKSDRHFTGDHEDKNRETEHSQVINKLHLLDFGLTYAVTERYSVSLNLPVQFATRSTPIRDAGGNIISRDLQEANGIDDLLLTGSAWLLDPKTFHGGNVRLSLGVKIPTGQFAATYTATVRRGNTFTHEGRTVDQSIQPGDGRVGATVGVDAFYLILEQYTLFLQGRYLFNPSNTNGVPTFRTGSGEDVMSVSDQFLGKAGIAAPIPFLAQYGFSGSLAGRVAGVPVRDALGDSDGFRRPGIAISIEPGIAWSGYNHTVGVSVPVALYRNRWQSVPDMRATPERHGDAAFVDYLILFNYSYNFGHGSKPREQSAS